MLVVATMIAALAFGFVIAINALEQLQVVAPVVVYLIQRSFLADKP